MKGKRKCPNCKSDNVIQIIYGMPGYDLFEKEQRGELKLGGCCIDIGESGEPLNPQYYCKDCHAEIYKGKKFEINIEENFNEK